MRKYLILAALAAFASPLAGQTTEAVINQIVDGNDANVVQVNLTESELVFAQVLQGGFGNETEVLQTHDGDAGGSLEAYVLQDGTGNVATIEQGPFAEMGGTMAMVSQVGDGNQASQKQVSQDNRAWIIQSGNGNIAEQEQDLELAENSDGSANNAELRQPGDGNLGVQQQNGLANNAINTQTGNGNELYVEQRGYGNQALSDQDADASLLGQHQESPLLFDGAFPANDALAEQLNGSQHYATQWQVGYGNDSHVVQEGLGNWVSHLQVGVGHTGDITQSGTGNTARLHQLSPGGILIP